MAKDRPNAILERMDDHPKKIRVTRLKDQDGVMDDLRDTTPAERVGMMWQLTVDAWAFMGEDVAEQRLQRDVERVIRRRR